MRRWERIVGLADEGKEGWGMANSIAAIKNYTTILDRVYQREATSSCLNSPARGAQREGDHDSEDLRDGARRLHAKRGSS